MYAFILQILRWVFLVYIAMAAFISIRDLLVTKGSILWVPLVGIFLSIMVLLFRTEWLPPLALPLTLLISVPIFLTDKRRNWDALDQVFRYVSILALLAAAFLTLNQILR